MDINLGYQFVDESNDRGVRWRHKPRRAIIDDIVRAVESNCMCCC